MLEILINKEDDKKDIALLEDGRLLEYYMEEENSNRNEGNIYVGVVKNVIKGMQAAFVDIGTEKNSFIHLKDILDKNNRRLIRINWWKYLSFNFFLQKLLFTE